VVNDDQRRSRIASMNELVHIKAELRNFDQIYQVMHVWHSETRLDKFDLKLHIIVKYIF